MHPSFLFSVESLSQHLRICLRAEDLFTANKTIPGEVLPGVTISFSGTEPSVPVEINCLDIAEIVAHEEQNAQFARLCGPELFSFLKKHHFYFPETVFTDVSVDEITAWQAVWLDIQYQIFHGTTGKHPVFRANTPARKNLPSNVIPLFSN